MSNSDLDYDRAKTLVERFYRRKRDEIETMRWALGLAATLFTTGMNEKEIKSLGEQLFDGALGFAVATLPGAFFLSKTWKSVAARRPVFAERLQFAQGTAFDAVGRIHGAVSGATNEKGAFSVALATTLNGVYSKLNRGLTAIEHEQSAMEDFLLERRAQSNTGSLVVEVEKTLGQMPPVLEAHLRDLFVTLLEHQLFKVHCASNVKVYKSFDITFSGPRGQPTLGLRVEGLNSGQLNYIYTRFGAEVTERQVRELLETLAKTIKESNGLQDLGRLFRKNIKNQSPLWPINGPLDICKHWGATYIISNSQPWNQVTAQVR